MLLDIGYMLLALSATSIAAADSPLPERLTEHEECTTIDIRNECSNLNILENCTVVIGYMMITLMPNNDNCDYASYKFPKLREITGFLIFTEVRGLTNITEMFPNLTVIRGRQLFLNYALGITNMHDLELLEFKSLVAIQRGHVYIGNCNKLCQLNKINWDRLTLSTGSNHIIEGHNNCSQPAVCHGCSSTYCWSNFTCQRLENDNLQSTERNSFTCHEECLGGCYNNTAADCVVCRGLTDAGVCVKKCPADKFLLELYQRCYTRDECVTVHEHYIYGFDCVASCPSGYKADENSECVRCDETEACLSVCSPDEHNTVITVHNLAEADQLRGCQIVNSSLIIHIRNKVNEEQLEQSLSTIREIRGHLKIHRSLHLNSLKFMSNLRRIHGDPLDHRHYAFVVYDNKQLSELWTPTKPLEFLNGGMFLHRNNKLCNKAMQDFQSVVIHDKVMDSLQTSDQEVLCGPAKLQLIVQVTSHCTLQFSWLKAQTSVELELIYRSVPKGKKWVEDTDLEAPVCTRINWQRTLLFADDLRDNGTHYIYQLDELQPNTRYACLLRTFGGDSQQEARSDMIYVQTLRDIPRKPTLTLAKKTDNMLTIRVAAQDHDYYMLNVIELPDDAAYIDERNFCKQTTRLWQDMDIIRLQPLQEYDYEDCCAYQAELNDDRRFIDQMDQFYRCSKDTLGNCDTSEKKTTNPLQSQFRLPANTTLYELRQLQRYRLYSLHLQACNNYGCSTSNIINERTNFTMGADMLMLLTVCRVPDTSHYISRFTEPQHPNGMVINYVIHFRYNVTNQPVETHLSCVTRRDHTLSKNVHLNRLNGTYNQAAVRVHSLAGDAMTAYVAITACDEEQSKLPFDIAPTAGNTTPLLSDVGPAVTELQETHSHAHGISIFVLCFLFGCGISLVWLLYKRRCWRNWPGLRRYVPVREQWLRERQQPEDREILVDGFETVRFQNNNNSNHSNSSNEY